MIDDKTKEELISLVAAMLRGRFIELHEETWPKTTPRKTYKIVHRKVAAQEELIRLWALKLKDIVDKNKESITRKHFDVTDDAAWERYAQRTAELVKEAAKDGNG
jgi:hypothetical protein